MRTRIVAAMLLITALAVASEAQSFSQLLQQAIYTQDTVGDLDTAIKLYQQIVSTAPATSEVRRQAQRRLLDATEARRRAALQVSQSTFVPGASGAQPLGVLIGRRYHHRATGLSLDLPDGWQLRDTMPSSDNGEMVNMVTADPETTVSVWMIPEVNDWNSINQRLDDSPAMKVKSRIESWGWRDYRLRAGSMQRTTFGGKQAMVAIGEYTRGPQLMTELLVWIYTEKSHIFFFSSVPADQLHILKPQFDALVESAIIP